MTNTVVCPTITAFDTSEYKNQMDKVAYLTRRVHIDLMDGEFAPTVSPPLNKVWWPPEIKADIHLMYQRPMEHLADLIKLRPRLVVIHNEAHVHHMHFAAELHKAGILAGLAILHDTPVENAYQIMHSFDHVLIFSGHLGYHGGEADLGLLDKVHKVRIYHETAEIGWDGGISAENAARLVGGGVDVLNVGGYIQHAADAQQAYARIKAALKT